MKKGLISKVGKTFRQLEAKLQQDRASLSPPPSPLSGENSLNFFNCGKFDKFSKKYLHPCLRHDIPRQYISWISMKSQRE